MYTKRAGKMHLKMTNYFHFTNRDSEVSFILSDFKYAMLICELIYLYTLKTNELPSRHIRIIKLASAKQ